MSPSSRRGSDRGAAVIVGGSENTLSAARSLGRRGVAVHILHDALGTRLPRFSRFVSSFSTVDEPARRFALWEKWFESGPPGAVVLAGGDTGLEFVAEHRDWLVERGYAPVEADDSVTLAMLDKASTYELARQGGIAVPRTAVVDTADDLGAAVADIGFPCALKPRDSYRFKEVFGAKAVVVHGPDDLRRSFAAVDEAGLRVLVTEIVPGVDDTYSSYYSYLDEHGEPLLHFTKRKLRQYPVGFGGGTYHVSHWDPEVADIGLQFFKSVGLRGLGNVEFKRDGRDGGLKLIECNPRPTAADALVRRAGVDVPYFCYLRALGHEPEPIEGFRDGVRLWYPGDDLQAFRAYRAAGHLTTARWLASLVHVQHFPLFDCRDPRPSIMGAGGRVLKALRRPRRRAARDKR